MDHDDRYSLPARRETQALRQRRNGVESLPTVSHLIGGWRERRQIANQRRSVEGITELLRAMQDYERERGRLGQVKLELRIEALEKHKKINQLLNEIAAQSAGSELAEKLLALRQKKEQVLKKLREAGIKDTDPEAALMAAHFDDEIMRLFDEESADGIPQ